MDRTALQACLERRLPATLELLEQLVSINSHTANAEGVRANATAIAAHFAELGFTARTAPCSLPDAGEHLALDSGGTGPVIACVGHLDTVFPAAEEQRNQFHWRPEGDRIYGPGTVDIKGGTALLWLMLSALAEVDPGAFAATRWVLLWNAAEERFPADFCSFCRDVLPTDCRACLVFEGDNESASGCSLVNGRKGSAKFHLRTFGRGAHAGNRHAEGANAIHQLARVIERVQGRTDYARELTFNVGWIGGGVADNRVPHAAEAKFEMRTYDQAVFDQAVAGIRNLAGTGDVTSPADGFACRVEIELLRSVAPWSGGAGTGRLLALWRVAGRELGIEVGAARRGGISDANLLARHFPVLDGLGPRGGNAHASESSPDGSKVPEFVDASSLVPKALLNLAALELLARD